jgi:hypothetical protein
VAGASAGGVASAIGAAATGPGIGGADAGLAADGGGKSTLGFRENFGAPVLAGAGAGALGAGGGGGTTAAGGAISTGAGGTGIGGADTGFGDSAGVEATEIFGFSRTCTGSAAGTAAVGATDALAGVSGATGVTDIFGRNRMTGAASAAGAVGSGAAAAGGAGSAAAGGVTVESVASFGLRRSLGIVSSLMPQGLASFPPSGNKILSNSRARDLRRDKPRQSVHIFRRLRGPGAAGPPQNSP